MTDDSPFTPFATKAVGITCTICCIEFDDNDERLAHWLDKHVDMLPNGFTDRVSVETSDDSLKPACKPYTGDE